MVFGLISYDANLSKYLMLFRISPQMHVIFMDLVLLFNCYNLIFTAHWFVTSQWQWLCLNAYILNTETSTWVKRCRHRWHTVWGAMLLARFSAYVIGPSWKKSLFSWIDSLFVLLQRIDKVATAMGTASFLVKQRITSIRPTRKFDSWLRANSVLKQLRSSAHAPLNLHLDRSI